jgi:hypothetical protein
MKNKHSRSSILELDKGNTFVEVTSPQWRTPTLLSIDAIVNDAVSTIEQLIKKEKKEEFNLLKFIDNDTLTIDENTLKIKVNSKKLITPSVFNEQFTNQNISYNKPPNDCSTLSGMHLMIDKDSNYLYVWVGDRWKRTSLSEW